MDISLIAAIGTNRALGKDNALLWRLSDDLKLFKALTLGHHILMGRLTYDSIGKPLPGRVNMIVSRNLNLHIEGVPIFKSLTEAMVFAEKAGEKELFIIGGGQLYKETLPLATKVYLTEVAAAPEADTFFPELSLREWKRGEVQKFYKSAVNEFDFTHAIWERKSH